MLPARLRSPAVALAHDSVMTVLAWYLAASARFNFGEVPEEYAGSLLFALLVVLPVQLLVSISFGLYRGIWRYASLPDALRIGKAVLAGTVISMAILFLVMRAEGIPRSVPVIYSLLLLVMLGGPRLIYRWYKDRHLYKAKGPRVLIVGAGHAGETLVRDMSRGALKGYQPIAFLDDKRRRHGREIHGVPIIDTIDALPQIVLAKDIELVLVAIPSATTVQKRRVVTLCEEANVPFLSVPELKDLLSGKVSVSELREISIEDLLGRDPVSLDWSKIEERLSGKRVLVSGGGGSIGSELCRQIAHLKPSELMILDNSEYNLYVIEREVRALWPDLLVHSFLGDVLDTAYVDCIFATHRPEVVFHAAAYKHVPMLESRPRQAARNNVIGTRNLARAADRFGVEVFVMVSTDKAVNPANVMGATKRVAEIFCQNLDALSETRFVTVRFGNVLGSAGSVVPLFERQIEKGGPVTVTDSRMQRYFMTIPESCQLIMQTTVMGNGGEIFVLDMGEPVKIDDLARQMILLSGKEPGKDIEIRYTGLRPGEKLYEELFHERESLEKTSHPKVMLARYRAVDWDWLIELLKSLEAAANEMQSERILALLHELVPEFDTPIDHEDETMPNRDNVVHLLSESRNQ